MYADSLTNDPIAAAVTWLQGALVGSVAIAIAIIAVASVGFLMLTGRIDFQRATQVIVGCFIIFGASTIAAGIQAAIARTSGGASQSQASSAPPADAPPPPNYPQPKPAQPYDPYAGAAVPTQQ